MNFKTTIIFAITLVVVALSLYFFNQSASDADVKPKPILEGLKLEDVRSFQITADDGQTLLVEKNNNAWRVAKPYNAPADDFKIESLLRSVIDLKSLGQNTSADLKTLRLDKPAFVIEINAKKSWKLSVSSKPSIGQECYALLDGDPVRRLIPESFVDTLDAPFDQYRSMNLFGVDSSSIKQIAIKSGAAPAIELEKHTQYDWRLIAPEKIDAETVAVNEFAISLTGLNAAAFVSESSIPTLTNPVKFPVTTIWFSTQAPSTQPSTPTTRPAGVTLSIGDVSSLKKDASVFVHLSPENIYAKVPASSFEPLKKSFLDFKDRRIVQIDPKQVGKIRIVALKDGKSTEILIERKKVDLTLGPSAAPASQPATKPANEDLPPSDWTLVSSNNAEASNADVETLLNRFNPLRASKFLPSDTAPVTQPSAKYTIEITAEIAGQSTVYTLEVLEPAQLSSPVAVFKNTTFELSRLFLESMTADYVNKPLPPEMPDMMGMPPDMGGLPPGMMGM